MKTINSEQAVHILYAHQAMNPNWFFTTVFVKRTDGELRIMNCRLNVAKYLKNGELAYNPKEKNLLPVCDMDIVKEIKELEAQGIDPLTVDKKKYKSPYRSINLNEIKEIRIYGETYVVK